MLNYKNLIACLTKEKLNKLPIEKIQGIRPATDYPACPDH